MKSKAIILLTIISAMLISFGLISTSDKSQKDALPIGKKQVSLEHEINIGLLSEDKF